MDRIGICGEISYYFAKVKSKNTSLECVTTLVIWVDALTNSAAAEQR